MVDVFEIDWQSFSSFDLHDFSPLGHLGNWLVVVRYRDGCFGGKPIVVDRCGSYRHAMLAQKVHASKDASLMAWLMLDGNDVKYVPADYEIWHVTDVPEVIHALEQLRAAGNFDGCKSALFKDEVRNG